MAEIRKQSFQVLETDMAEMNRKIREHRLKIVKWILAGTGSILLIILILYAIAQIRTYDSHEELSSAKRADTSATTFVTFCGKILKYGNDGVSYTDCSNHLIWSQAYEMINPMLTVSKKYAALADERGTMIYILDAKGLCGKIETAWPIVRIGIADQGTIAILSEEKGTSHLKLCDKTGKELAEGELHVEKNGFPLDIAISPNGEKLAVSMLNVQEGTVKSVISFYHFGSAGQKKTNNIVGTKEYQDTVIPQIEYIENDKMIAVGDQKLLIFEEAKKPKEKKEIKYDSRLRTFFRNDKYFGLILDNESSPDKKNETYHLIAYDSRGAVVKEINFSRTYRKAEFLDNGEICLLNDNECTIFTLRGVEKYHEIWNRSVYKVLSESGFANYRFIMEGETVSVKLRKRRN